MAEAHDLAKSYYFETKCNFSKNVNVEYFGDLSMFIYLLEEDVWYDTEENLSEQRYGSNGQDCRFSEIWRYDR